MRAPGLPKSLITLNVSTLPLAPCGNVKRTEPPGKTYDTSSIFTPKGDFIKIDDIRGRVINLKFIPGSAPA